MAIAGIGEPEDLFEPDGMIWILVTPLLLAIGWGLWKGRVWGRTIAIIVHWPILVGAVILFATSLLIVALVPASGIAVLHVFVLIGLFLFPLIAVISGWALWYLHRCTPQ